MELLTSRTNPTVKSAVSLKENSERKKTGLFLLEGARLCADAAQNGVRIKTFFVTEKALSKYEKEASLLEGVAQKSYLISESVAEKLSDTKNSQQFFAVCFEKKSPFSVDPSGMYIFTDNVQNPDNLGAIARTAEALGADGLMVNSGCDIYSPKALRASMGALLRFPVIKVEDAPSYLKSLSSQGFKIFASVVSPDAEDVVSADKKGGCVLIIGNEGNGVSDEILSVSTNRITIHMKGKAESLNASAAATLLIWEFTK